MYSIVMYCSAKFWRTIIIVLYTILTTCSHCTTEVYCIIIINGTGTYLYIVLYVEADIFTKIELLLKSK
jgi:hypothetical protein